MSMVYDCIRVFFFFFFFPFDMDSTLMFGLGVFLYWYGRIDGHGGFFSL